MTENDIRLQILEWIELHPQRGKAWIHNSKAPKKGGTYFRRGRFDLNYVSDIEGIWDCRPLYIEVKLPGSSPQKARFEGQKTFLEEVARLGGIGILAYDLKTVIDTIGPFGQYGGICVLGADPSKK